MSNKTVDCDYKWLVCINYVVFIRPRRYSLCPFEGRL